MMCAGRGGRVSLPHLNYTSYVNSNVNYQGGREAGPLYSHQERDNLIDFKKLISNLVFRVRAISIIY